MTAQRASTAPSRRVDHPRITVLVDDDRALDGLEREHGLSLWVEAGDARGLTDTGVLADLEHLDRMTGGRPLARLVGGTHLVHAFEALIALVAGEILRRSPMALAPCHSAARPAAALFKRTLPQALLPLGSGAVVE